MTINETEKLISESDKSDTGINAIIARDPHCAEEVPSGALPLAGMIVGIKDNIDTVKLGNSAGSLALVEAAVEKDAFIVEKLRAAGGLIYAKTNLSEWANFRSTRSISGWSSVGGQTRNPHAPERSPCGSSSGSAAAVAAGYFPLAIGTETDGSIICPAAMNGIVGLKPTHGRLSRSGIVPIAESQDTAGPMARTVNDAALLLEAMDGEDEHDPATISQMRSSTPTLFSYFDLKNLQGLNIGACHGDGSFLPAVHELFGKTVTQFGRQGAEIHEIDAAKLEEGKQQLFEAEFKILLCEFKDDIAAYLGEYRPAAAVSNLRELIAFNEAHREEAMPFFGQELFQMAEETDGRKDAGYKAARAAAEKLALTEGLEAIFNAHSLDLLLMPSNNPAWLIDPILGDNHTGSSSSFPAVSGWPSITIPMGQIQGLPVGLTIIGRPWQEARILGVAHFFAALALVTAG